jgi:putative transposase
MSQSLTRLYAHITFSTKDRYPYLVQNSLREELHSYIGGVLKTLDSQPVIIGGVADHVHILSRMSKNHSISKIIGEVKRVSSIWIKTKSPDLSRFHWQNGYGAFSIGRSEINAVENYIRNQEGHHRIKTFKDEFLSFLHEYEIEYDERYVWD